MNPFIHKIAELVNQSRATLKKVDFRSKIKILGIFRLCDRLGWMCLRHIHPSRSHEYHI